MQNARDKLLELLATSCACHDGLCDECNALETAIKALPEDVMADELTSCSGPGATCLCDQHVQTRHEEALSKMSAYPQVIFAGTYDEAQHYARRLDLHRSDWIYLDGADRLLGLENLKIWRCGSYVMRTDAEEVMQMIRRRRCELVDGPSTRP